MTSHQQPGPAEAPGRRKDKIKRSKKSDRKQAPAASKAEAAPQRPLPAEPIDAAVAVAPPEAPAPASAAGPATPAPEVAPAVGIQALANAYRDYAKKSLADAQSFAEKLTAARSFDTAVEAQSEFARKACETFAADARKIRELHRELFWQAFGLPGRTR
jgi:hypothetical protein